MNDHERPPPQKLCVYTTLIGGYEPLKEQPAATGSNIPFICLTDDPELRSETWQIRRVVPLLDMDPIRSQRRLKIQPQIGVGDFEASLYIDNTVSLTAAPERIFERYFRSGSFCVPRHSYRETILDEFLEVARIGLDDQSRIFEQLNHYMIEHPEMLEQRPFWSAVMLRDHRSPRLLAMQEIWLTHVMRYSRRDQLSMNLAFQAADLPASVIDIDNFASWFHSWPHLEGRQPQKPPRLPSASHSPARAVIRRLELDMADAAARHDASLAEQRLRHAEAMARLEADCDERLAALAGERDLALRALADARDAANAGLVKRLSNGLRDLVLRHPALAGLLRRLLRRLRG